MRGFGILGAPVSARDISRESQASVAGDVYSLAASLWHLLSGCSPFAELGVTMLPPSLPPTRIPPPSRRVLKHQPP